MQKNYDFYNTDPSVINDLLARYPQFKNEELRVLEPAAGQGILADRFYSLTNNKMDTYDIEPKREDIEQKDFMKLDSYNKYDLIITNFPHEESKAGTIGFSELVKKALMDVKPNGYVCILQRLTSLESKKRYEKIYGRRPPEKILIYSHRLKCYKTTKDDLINTTIPFCWCIYHKDADGFFNNKTELEWIY